MNEKRKAKLMALTLTALCFTTAAGAEPKYLPRSLYVPLAFELCEHLTQGIFYENDQPIMAMPAERTFQFTYYPDLDKMLPEQVPIRVEGKYADNDEPFVAKLAVTPNGLHTARRSTSLDANEQMHKQTHKVDFRLKPRTFKLACKRFCKKAKKVASTASANQ